MLQLLRLKYLLIICMCGAAFTASSQAYCWTPLGDSIPSLNLGSGQFTAVCADANNVYTAGNTETVFGNGPIVNIFNKYTGWAITQLPLDSGVNNGTVTALCLNNEFGSYYAAVEAPNGYYVVDNTGARLGLGTNGLLANGPITSICANNGTVYAAGQFTDASGYYYVARWDGGSWTELTGLNATSPIAGICMDALNSNTIYAAIQNNGNATTALWNGGWTNLGAGLYAGGLNTAVCSPPSGGVLVLTNALYLQYWNNTWKNVYHISYNVGSTGLAICTDSLSNIYVGQSNGTVVECAWDSSNWQVPGGTGACSLHGNGEVATICSFNGGVAAAGNFTNGQPYNYYVAYYGPYLNGPAYVYLTATNVNCGTAGSITSAVGGAAPPYTYLWSTGQTTANLSMANAGTYYVTVTDSVGKSATGYIVVDTGCVTYVTGSIYNDLNGNCINDAGDAPFTEYTAALISRQGQVYYATTDALGNYSFALPDTGLYRYVFSSLSNCVSFEYCPGYSDSVYVTTLGGTLQQPPVAVIEAHTDLTTHPGWTAANPGFTKQYWVMPFNAMPYPVTGNVTVIFTYDPNLQYQSSLAPFPTVDTVAHTLTWVVAGSSIPYPNFNWVNERFISYFLVPATLSTSYQLQSNFTILPLSGDCDTANNSMSFSESITGSHDPNAKQVYPSGNTTVNDTALTYTIFFQNTGNASTHFVTVTDTLSPYLQPASVVNVASSAPYSSFNVSGQGVLTWVFNPLTLPQASVDSIGSNGFITFTINKAANIPFGTNIANAANIYFDYNTAIITDTTADTVLCSYSWQYDTAVCPQTGYLFGGILITQAGTYTDTLSSVAGCDSFVVLTLIHKPAPVLTLSTGIDTFCNQGTPVAITALPAGGALTGTGVTGTQFTPAAAGLGEHTLTYSYADTDNCVVTASEQLYVITFPDTAILVQHYYDSAPEINVFYIQGLPDAEYTWQQLLYSVVNGADSAAPLPSGGDTLYTFCPQYGSPCHIDSIFAEFFYVRAIVNLDGCIDTTGWYLNICQIWGGAVNNVAEDNALTLFPNPATDQLFIKTDNIYPDETIVYDINGRVIYTLPFKHEVDINALSSGVYFIEVRSNGMIARKRFVKM